MAEKIIAPAEVDAIVDANVDVVIQPNRHVRVALTWLAIFPLVSLGFIALAPFTQSWNSTMRALLLTACVVPLASYVVVPFLVKIYVACARYGLKRHFRRRAMKSELSPDSMATNDKLADSKKARTTS